MNCNDCCREIEHCVCSLFGGKRIESKLRALAEKQRRQDPPGSYRDATGELVLPSTVGSPHAE